jgi:hypothetical protein
MSREAFSRVVDAVAKPLEDVLPEALKEHSATVVLAAGGGLALLTARAVMRNFYKSNPFNFGRTGALSADEINNSIVNYEKFFDQKDGKGINDGQVTGKAKSNTPEFVDKFYRCARVRRRRRAGLFRQPCTQSLLHMRRRRAGHAAAGRAAGRAVRAATPPCRAARGTARRRGAAGARGRAATGRDSPSRWFACFWKRGWASRPPLRARGRLAHSVPPRRAQQTSVLAPRLRPAAPPAARLSPG